MRLTKNKLKLLNPAIQSAVALLVLSGGNVAIAQEATTAPPVASAEEGGVNKVVVTARRREETLQDVPVSVTAFSADQLSKVATPDITASNGVIQGINSVLSPPVMVASAGESGR